jgi:hypothetical protein
MMRRTRLTLTVVCLPMLFLPLLEGRADKTKPAEPQWGYGLQLKCRAFETPTFDQARSFGLEVYQDKGKALYITETGVVAAGTFGKFDQAKTRPPTWIHNLDLKVRPAGFELPLKKFGVETYGDENNGHWMYICQSGALGVVPGAGAFKPAKPMKGPGWLHGFELKVRKAGEEKFNKKTKAWGVEVSRDANNANLVYLCENGMLAIVPGARDTAAPARDPKAPLWLYSFNLTVRKAGPPPARFATFGVEVYRDENNGNLIYVSETGSLAVVPDKKKLRPPLGKPKPPTLVRQFTLKCREASEKDFGSLTFGIASFVDPNSDCTVYISEKGSIAAVAKATR